MSPTMDYRPRARGALRGLRDRELIRIGCVLGGGTFGRDPARLSRAAKIDYLLGMHAASDILRALDNAEPCNAPHGDALPEAPVVDAIAPPSPEASTNGHAGAGPGALFEEAVRALAGASASDARVREIEARVQRLERLLQALIEALHAV
ncbi:MAG: hypothetical protein KGL39_09125 [Patescibacteria group bacterium]|nr:hypothetical protein [Patescibacteria group bacterium]